MSTDLPGRLLRLLGAIVRRRRGEPRMTTWPMVRAGDGSSWWPGPTAGSVWRSPGSAPPTATRSCWGVG